MKLRTVSFRIASSTHEDEKSNEIDAVMTGENQFYERGLLLIGDGAN